ncbi:hypothetical protein [Cohnella cellulosilytica]|uniref:Uncharacterized protein n=1 Tax=Cohnella cellulosilytica TaxID=986710 RepID=A0ABW2FJ44_9BACL
MSYKPIDMQVSMPRSVEMTPLQHHQQQRSATEQSLLGQQAMKTAEQNATRSAKAESAEGGTISERDPRERGKRGQAGQHASAEEQHGEEHKAPEHPYKGKHIDFLG